MLSNATIRELHGHKCSENDILTIKGGRDTQNLHGFFLLHAAFLDKVVLAFENIVRPTIGRLGNELKLFFPVQTREEEEK